MVSLSVVTYGRPAGYFHDRDVTEQPLLARPDGPRRHLGLRGVSFDALLWQSGTRLPLAASCDWSAGGRFRLGLLSGA